MARSMKYGDTSSSRRRTWPPSDSERLETILESPQLLQPSRFHDTLEPGKKTSCEENPSIPPGGEHHVSVNGDNTSPHDTRAQMIWYSHHLEASHKDRDRLMAKIAELEHVCRTKSKLNATLLREAQAWQSDYEQIELELVEAAEEIGKAKAYVKDVEVTNANLRYALGQLREEQEQARRRQCKNILVSFWQRCTNSPMSSSSSSRPSTARSKRRLMKHEKAAAG